MSHQQTPAWLTLGSSVLHVDLLPEQERWVSRRREAESRRRLVVCVLLAAVLAVGGSLEAQPTVLYSTGFEASAGFNTNLPLVRQLGWTGLGSDSRIETNANGIVVDFFPDSTQQAFVGFAPLSGTNYSLNVWKPLNFDPIAAGKPVVRFTVEMAIFDSTTDIFDCFRWSTYNISGERLFTIDFDNSTLGINYLLEDDVDFVSTGYAFEHEGTYDLEIVMNFAMNRWSAKLTGSASATVLVSSEKITTRGSALNIGDIDAVWVYGPSTNAPGDNFMVFDNYRVTAEADAPLPFELQAVGPAPGGMFLLHLSGEPGRDYAIEVSQNLASWTPIRTNNANDGTFDFIDSSAARMSPRFYRARLVR